MFMYKLFSIQFCFFSYSGMDRVRSWWGQAANFVAGVEAEQHGEGEDDGGVCMVKDDEREARIYLVTYGGYGPLPSFDPDCLTAMVTRQI